MIPTPPAGTRRSSKATRYLWVSDVAKSGHVKVTVLDKENEVLAESDPITETGTDVKMKWTEKFSLEKLKGGEIKLRFELKGASSTRSVSRTDTWRNEWLMILQRVAPFVESVAK
jgi:hypothetical protein